jgi:hypothetical protein
LLCYENEQQSAIQAEDIDHPSLEAHDAGTPLQEVVEERNSLTAIFSPNSARFARLTTSTSTHQNPHFLKETNNERKKKYIMFFFFSIL